MTGLYEELFRDLLGPLRRAWDGSFFLELIGDFCDVNTSWMGGWLIFGYLMGGGLENTYEFSNICDVNTS